MEEIKLTLFSFIMAYLIKAEELADTLVVKVDAVWLFMCCDKTERAVMAKPCYGQLLS